MANTLRNVEFSLVNTNGAHFKFWKAMVQCRVVRLTWGRIGGRSSQSRKFTFRNNEEALDFAHRRMDIRQKGGFREIATFTCAA